MNVATSNPPCLIERGRDHSVCMVGFSAFRNEKNAQLPYDYLDISRALDYSRIMFLDYSRTCYFGGLPPIVPNFFSLEKFLKEKLAELNPEKTIFVGSSGGSAAALVFGHLLKADYVHAFGPHTSLTRETVEKLENQSFREERRETLERLWALPQEVQAFLDIRQVIKQHNGRSRFFIHVCRNCEDDFRRAHYLSGLPGVEVMSYSCDHHRVVRLLAKAGLLQDILRIENQDNLLKLFTAVKRVNYLGPLR